MLAKIMFLRNNRKLWTLLFTITFSLLICHTSSKAQSKYAIQVEYQGENDIVGSRLVYSFKEKIRLSASLRLTNIEEPKIIIRINTMDIFKDLPKISAGKGAIYSVTWISHNHLKGPGPIFLYDTLGVCGGGRVEDIAELIIATTDETLSKFFPIPPELDRRRQSR